MLNLTFTTLSTHAKKQFPLLLRESWARTYALQAQGEQALLDIEKTSSRTDRAILIENAQAIVCKQVIEKQVRLVIRHSQTTDPETQAEIKRIYGAFDAYLEGKYAVLLS